MIFDYKEAIAVLTGLNTSLIDSNTVVRTSQRYSLYQRTE